MLVVWLTILVEVVFLVIWGVFWGVDEQGVSSLGGVDTSSGSVSSEVLGVLGRDVGVELFCDREAKAACLRVVTGIHRAERVSYTVTGRRLSPRRSY